MTETTGRDLIAVPATVVASVRRLMRARPTVADALITALAAVFAVTQDAFDHHGSGPAALVFDLAIALPLFFRRRWSAEVFVGIAGICLIQWLTDTIAFGDVLVLFALYAVGAYERRRWLVGAAAATAEFGVVLAVARWAPPGQTVSAMITLTGTVTAACVIGIYVRTRRAYLASILDRAATAERDRDQQALIAVGAERARIAREMHDIVAHSLSVMIALTDGAAATAERDPPEARQAMRQASATGRQALAEMRRLLEVLRSGDDADRAPQPGTADLDDLIDRVRSAGLPVDVTIGGDRAHTPPSAQLAVYRIVQESLTNVLKHADNATRAAVRLRYDPAGVDIEVSDDGAASATDPERSRAPARGGHGLTGIQERAAVFGGQVESGRWPDGSWHVSTRLHVTPSGPAS